MLKRLALPVLGALLLSSAAAVAQADVSTLTFVDDSSVGLSLYVDHTARCYAPPHGSCKTDIDPGDHSLGAVTVDGDTVRERTMTVEAGYNYTWTVSHD